MLECLILWFNNAERRVNTYRTDWALVACVRPLQDLQCTHASDRYFCIPNEAKNRFGELVQSFRLLHFLITDFMCNKSDFEWILFVRVNSEFNSTQHSAAPCESCRKEDFSSSTFPSIDISRLLRWHLSLRMWNRNEPSSFEWKKEFELIWWVARNRDLFQNFPAAFRHKQIDISATQRLASKNKKKLSSPTTFSDSK